MVSVPAGEFTMGSPDGEGDDNEHPQHTVTLDAFWIDRTEVTNGQIEQCVTAGACGWQTTPGFDSPDQPVVDIPWERANQYCRWAGARLPTEEEWEKAARGTDGRRYPWGNEDPTCERANTSGCVGKTAPVGSYAAGASPYGALDMAGNAWEWVADWHGGDRSVLRGGSWGIDPDHARCAYRGDYPLGRVNYDGFRCCVSSTSSLAEPIATGAPTLPRGTFRPPTGIVVRKAGGAGPGELTVKNDLGTGDGLAVLTRSGQPVLAAYVRNKERFTLTGISDGRYELYFSLGVDWDGRRFTREPSYARFEEAFVFHLDDVHDLRRHVVRRRRRHR